MKELFAKIATWINEFSAKMMAGKIGIIRATILLLGLFAVSVVWPMGKFVTVEKSEAVWDGMRFSGPCNEGGYIRQEFSPNFQELTSVSVYVVNEADSIDTLETFVRIYDAYGNLLADRRVNLENYVVPGWVDVEVNLSVTPGDIYFLTAGGTDGDLFVALCSDQVGNAENGAFYYKEVPSGGTNGVIRYTYERPWGIKRIITADIVIMILTLFVYCVATILINKLGKNAILKLEKIFKVAECIIFSIAAVVSCVFIAGFKAFTSDTANIIVLCVSVCSIAGMLIYCVTTSPSMLLTEDDSSKSIWNQAVVFIRSALLSGAIIMTCMYQNGATDFEKGLWTRRMIVFFGLFVFSMAKKSQIWNIPSLIWSFASIGIGKYYISLHNDHPEHISTATSTAWVIWIAGLILIQLIYKMVAKEYKNLKKISLPFAIVLILFWALCCVFSSGRTWPILTLIIFGLAIALIYQNENKYEFTECVCNGYLMSFFATALFCIYRRPYQYYMMTRYPGVFFTVTVTATFYLIGGAAAITKLLLSYKSNNKRGVILSLISLGTVGAFLLFTASRTGIMGFAAELLFAFAVWQCIRKKRNSKKKHEVINAIGALALSFVILFVSNFGLVRMVPSLVHNPFYFGHESFCEFIFADTPIDGGERVGEQYATIQVALNLLFGRLFTTGSDSDAFGNDVLSLTAHAMTVDELEKEQSAVEQYSNGRMDIFRAYISNLNLLGHKSMDLETEDGQVLMHAHNTYIQLAYDFGLILGVVFLLVCLYALIRAMKIAQDNPLPLILTAGFGMAGLVEWIYHPMNPIGFAFILVCVILVEKKEKRENE